ncbi:MAG: hypothetical protein LAN71_14700 [Acidobacteriia bacterium]|nr:hypothetical protein [Terriglobia bacterium]
MAGLVAAMILAAIFASPASAQNREPGAQPRERKQLSKGVLAGNLIRVAPEKMVIRPNLFQTQSRAAIAFKAFEMKDPKTDKPIAPTAIITLPNGKKPTAQQYYSELNNYEKWLSEHGHSLHTTPRGAKTKLHEIPLDHGLIQRQIQLAPRPSALARRPNLLALNSYRNLSTPQAVQLKPEATTLNHAPIANRAIIEPAVKPAGSVPAPNAAVKPPNPNMPAVAAREVTLEDVNQKLAAANVRGIMRDGMVIDTQTIDRIAATVSLKLPTPTRPGVATAPVLMGQCKSINDSQNWNWEVGDPSTFEAYVNGSISLTGKACAPAFVNNFQNNASTFKVTAEGKAGGTVFGIGGELLRITGEIGGDGPKNTVSAGLGIYALGLDIFSLNKTATAQWGIDDHISKDVDFSVSIPIPVGPFNIDATIGTKGSVGFQYSIALFPTNVSISGGPFVHSSVYAQASLSVVVAEAGVGVNLTLINWDMTLHGTAGLGWNHNFFIQEELYADSNLNMLGGNMYVFAKVYYPCLDPWPDICNSEWDANLWSWDGLQYNSVLFDVKNTTQLPW